VGNDRKGETRVNAAQDADALALLCIGTLV
jgi:hypothetical protein